MSTPIKSINSIDTSGNNISYNSVRECGVYMYNGSSKNYWRTPIYYSVKDMTNLFSQQYTTTTPVTTPAQSSADPTGKYIFLDVNGVDDLFEVHPNYGIVAYSNKSWDTMSLNFKNTTYNPVSVTRDSTQGVESCRIYYNDVEQTMLT
jgi:hypothetical protein